MTPLLISDNTAAALLGISRATFWRVKAREMPQPVKIGGSTRWRFEDVQAAVAALSATEAA